MEFTRNQKKALDLNRHISVTAGAGSGKTAVLVHRYLKILLEKDLPPNQVVAITFTEKAAAELKQRVVNEVNTRLQAEPHNARLEEIKTGMLSAQISTIHAFCSQILREYPVEAGVDADFSVLQGIQQRLILRETIDSGLREIADRPNEDEIRAKLVELLRIFGKSRLEIHLSELVNQRWAVERLKRNLYYRTDSEVLEIWQGYVQSGLTKSLAQYPTEDWFRCLSKVLEVAKGTSAVIVLELVGGIFPGLAILSMIPLFLELGSRIIMEDGQISSDDSLDSNAEIDTTMENVGFLVRAANYFQSSPSIANASIALELVGSLVPELAILNVVSIFRELAPLIVTKEGKIRKRDFLGSRVETDTIKEEIDFLARAGNHFLSFPSITDDDELLIRVTRPLLAVYSEVHDAYENQKSEARQLDFNDLQIKVRDLLQREESIREQLTQRYPYIMVDEYQDTDQLQYEILRPLISDFKSGNLAIVGDQNQSIYRFRGADVRVYDQTREEITKYQSTLGKEFTWEGTILEANDLEKHGDLQLPENFRLLRNLVGFVNLVFRSLMKGRNEFEIKYQPLIQGRTTDSFGNIEMLIGSKIQIDGDSQSLIDANDLITKRIRHLVGSGETIWEDDGDGEKPRPIRYGDIAILIRSRTRLPEIESALLKAKVPYKITGGIGFYQRQEIYDIGNYLEFLIDPTSDVALAGVLRAPFFGVSDVELYEIAQHSSSEPFWKKIQDYVTQTDQPSTAPLGYAVQILRNHLEICHRIPPSALIRKLVNDTGMVGVLPVGQSGEQRWANYEKLLGIARELERLGFTDLHDFLERLNLLIEEEEREGQATTQLTADAVQIMTIHAAKGLEFPVVILPNLDRRAARYDQEPFIDDLLGIGFRPANPAKNYEQGDPGVTQLMRDRAKDKRAAEEQRLFYVATTRARDRLILSGSLDDKGRARDWLAWLFDALDITKIPTEEEFLTRRTTIHTLSGERTKRVSFDLPIRIIKSPNQLDDVEAETPTRSLATEFPAYCIEPLTASSANRAFSVAELTTYAHCPTRFYLQHQIQVPPSDSQSGETDETTRRDVNRFLDSRVREIAVSADEVYRERHIHAEIGSHIVEGIADRFFKDSRGLWQVINYERDRIDWEAIDDSEDYYRSQIELYALLVHRLYPEQQVIPVTVYPTDLVTAHSVEITGAELEDIESTWLGRIKAIQETVNADAIGAGRFEKNLGHCPLCPYFVDGECMVAD